MYLTTAKRLRLFSKSKNTRSEEENNQKRPLLNLIALIGNLYRLNGLLINTESNQDQYVISLSRIFWQQRLESDKMKTTVMIIYGGAERLRYGNSNLPVPESKDV